MRTLKNLTIDDFLLPPEEPAMPWAFGDTSREASLGAKYRSAGLFRGCTKEEEQFEGLPPERERRICYKQNSLEV